MIKVLDTGDSQYIGTVPPVYGYPVLGLATGELLIFRASGPMKLDSTGVDALRGPKDEDTAVVPVGSKPGETEVITKETVRVAWDGREADIDVGFGPASGTWVYWYNTPE